MEQATRLAQFYTRSDKIYEGVVRFGWSTNTYDRAGEPTSENLAKFVSTAAELELTPRAVSAASSCKLRRRYRPRRSEGSRAYELARQSIAVELAPVPVRVYELTCWN